MRKIGIEDKDDEFVSGGVNVKSDGFNNNIFIKEVKIEMNKRKLNKLKNK